MHVVLSILLLAFPPTLSVDKIHPGDQGKCLTVFEGTDIEPFSFEVKGIMPNFVGPGQDVVVVQLVGEKVEHTGVVAGMSGSPCFVREKLIGALAYAFAPFAKDAIAGITPIANMRDILKLETESLPWSMPSTKKLASLSINKTLFDVESSCEGLCPMVTPLSVGGVSTSVLGAFEDWFETMRFLPIAGGSAATKTGTKTRPLAPGSPAAAVLVSGDVAIAATGTVTWVEGDRALAFGHPFLGLGNISIPLAESRIVTTVVSQLRSFKMAATGRMIGAVVQDRLTGIAGKLGNIPATVPVQGQVRLRGKKRTFTLNIARDPALTPRFLAIATAGALSGRVEKGTRGIARVSGEIGINGVGMEPVRFEQVYAAERDGNLFVRGARDLAEWFNGLWNTPFGPPPDMRVNLKVSVEPSPLREWIEGIYLDQAQVRPGDMLNIAIRVRRDKGGRRIEHFQLPILPAWADQELDIVAAGAIAAEHVEHSVAGDAYPSTLADIGKWLSKRRSQGKLYVMATHKGVGLRAGVDMVQHVPPSMAVMLSGDSTRAVKEKVLAWEEYRVQPGTITGEAHASVKVVVQGAQ